VTKSTIKIKITDKESLIKKRERFLLLLSMHTSERVTLLDKFIVDENKKKSCNIQKKEIRKNLFERDIALNSLLPQSNILY
jgi:hypothetical protein